MFLPSRWRYVITSILEVDVKPRLHMWSWQHIRRHRIVVKRYRELYKTKITSKKPSEELLKQLEVGLWESEQEHRRRTETDI